MTGRRVDRSAATSRRRATVRPTFALAGCAVLVLAGCAATFIPSHPTDDADGPTALTVAAAPGSVDQDSFRALTGADYLDVSRSVDRAELKRQAEQQAQQRTQALRELAKATQARAEDLELNQWVLPLTGYTLTATFGETSSLWSTVHTGLDFAAPSGTPLVAIAHGTVTAAGYDGSYGNKTEITLDDGTVIWYCHQTSYDVAVGDEVDPGQVIGTVGATGNVTGPHLHLEVHPAGGDAVDPFTALTEHGVTP